MYFLSRTYLLIFSISLIAQNTVPFDTYHLNSIFTEQRECFAGFLDNVLQQKKSSDFYAAVHRIINQEHPKNDAEYYNALLKHRDQLVPFFKFLNQLKLLRFQKKLLTKQAKMLLGQRTINGYVEIGTPGTYLSKLSKRLKIKGDRFAINDQKRKTDHFQAFAFNPFNGFLAYNQFVPLNNYAPISKRIASKSIDLIVCFIGLHHIPTEKLDAFVSSIARVLKHGGTFLLREHDCCDEQTKSIIYGAHSIYNIVIPGESCQTEIAEYRNFQPLNFWIKLLESHGFHVDTRRITQKGDPTRNTMIKCTKIAHNKE